MTRKRPVQMDTCGIQVKGSSTLVDFCSNQGGEFCRILLRSLSSVCPFHLSLHSHLQTAVPHPQFTPSMDHTENETSSHHCASDLLIDLESRVQWLEENPDRSFEDKAYYDELHYQESSSSIDDPYRKKTLEERATTLVHRNMNYKENMGGNGDVFLYGGTDEQQIATMEVDSAPGMEDYGESDDDDDEGDQKRYN